METNLLPFDKRSGKGSGGGGKTQRKGEDGIRKEKHVSIPAFFPVSSFLRLVYSPFPMQAEGEAAGDE